MLKTIKLSPPPSSSSLKKRGGAHDSSTSACVTWRRGVWRIETWSWEMIHERYKGLWAHTILTPGKCVIVLPFVDVTLAPVAAHVNCSKCITPATECWIPFILFIFLSVWLLVTAKHHQSLHHHLPWEKICDTGVYAAGLHRHQLREEIFHVLLQWIVLLPIVLSIALVHNKIVIKLSLRLLNW